uniref:Uncharacterized protein n=1 Tax=Hemiselmis andersenii TaxID=464988 RepID=A0A7S0U2Q6_HEMAN|mmetsp:Transcript_32801/g.76409  ORF Transcript_32801/g.76409 Transcript_32801/m.76409 type:complete len:208 (+) Transcript_32801:470-1093(+)
MKAQAGLSGGWLSSRDPEDGAFKVHRDDLLSRLVFEAGMHGATPSVNADSLKRAVKGFWVPRTGASSHAFDKGTEWIRTEAELPANVQLLVAYGRLRKKEAVRGNRTDDAELLMACGRLWSEGFEKGGKHDDAAARGSPRVCRVDPQLLLGESLRRWVGRVVRSVRERFGACREWEDERERNCVSFLLQVCSSHADGKWCFFLSCRI